jgi:hypothetical protein
MARAAATAGDEEVRRMTRHFGYAIDRRYLPVLLPFLLRPSRDGVTLTDHGFVATFGLVKVTTPRTNITGAHVTRNYRWWTACGVRMSSADDGLTFGTNRDAGLCIHFAERVRSPQRRSGHSALTVTVADLEGLEAALGGDEQ